MTTGKTAPLTRRTLVGKVMTLLLNMLSRLVITRLQSNKSGFSEMRMRDIQMDNVQEWKVDAIWVVLLLLVSSGCCNKLLYDRVA